MSDNNYFTFQDIVDTKKRGGRELPIDKLYDPEKFWVPFANDFYAGFKNPQQFNASVPWLSDRFKVLILKLGLK